MGNQLRGKDGCGEWEREPGIDDDDWDPPGTPTIGPYRADPPSAPRARSRGTDGWWTESRRSPRPVPPPAPEPAFRAQVARDPFGGLFNWQDD